MYCPKCGLEALNDARFCSRCGLPLAAIAELVSNGGLVAGPVVGANSISPKRRGMRTGAKLLFWSVISLPLIGGLCALFEDPSPLILPVTVFLAGLSWLLYCWLFREDFVSKKSTQVDQPYLKPKPRESLPNNEQFTSSYIDRKNTSDLADPGSITDHTTQLFDQDRR